MKIRKKWLVISSIVLAVILVRAVAGGRGSRTVDVNLSTASLGSLEERADGYGALEGVTRVEISAARAGIVSTLAVDEGDQVHVGDLLIKLETETAQAGVDEANAKISSAVITRDQAVREEWRIEALWDSGMSSEEELTRAREAVRLSQAAVNQACAARTLATNSLEKTAYYSPIDGIVTEINIEEGEMAVVGTMNTPGTVLITVEDMSTFLVRITMVESEIVNVSRGQLAEIELDAFPDTVFHGIVENVALASQMSSGGDEAAEYEVLVRLDEPVSRMRSGMSATVEVITSIRESCVIVPIQSIVQRPDPEELSSITSCVLAMENGYVRVIPVETGITGMMDVEVSGIDQGTSVVTGPTELLRTLNDGDVLSTGGRNVR